MNVITTLVCYILAEAIKLKKQNVSLVMEFLKHFGSDLIVYTSWGHMFKPLAKWLLFA